MKSTSANPRFSVAPSASPINPQQQYRRPNSALTEDERRAKRERKQELKRQRKRKKLETRLQHAIRRKDASIEQETRQALQDMGEEAEEGEHRFDRLESIAIASLDTPERRFIEKICQALLQHHQSSQQASKQESSKEMQTAQAVTLLHHMTKGTQSRDMFDNPDALWGYTRQKFFERALLVCSSFQKLNPKMQPSSLNDAERRTRRVFWERLCSVKRIYSIGCGPGNDIVGVVAFLKSCRESALDSTGPLLERACLFDFAVTEWNIVLDPLQKLMEPMYIEVIDKSLCNAAKSMDSPENKALRDLLCSARNSAQVDLVLISYLLTELRGKWEGFMRDLITAASPNTIFYFAEPTPWQLHQVCRVFADSLEFIWVDSSMNHSKELQSLDNRLGPGVLLGRKR